MGVDRVLELAKAAGLVNSAPALDVYAIVTEPSAMPLVLSTLQSLRIAGVSVQMHTSTSDGMGSMKSQFKRADVSGARYALIFGADEIKTGQVTIKPLRESAAQQTTQPLSNLASWMTTLQSSF
ncbi:histidine--tRNA ligase [mine drainage metagenome]|uniref:Histidine--tRNA ligase n=1 Tax=mine drainage metagenome TaxID=410659 RepID=A0A1J5PD88_9ZZZZ